jgi:ribosomal-protein-alanine N-acetyltransferase
MSSFYRATSDSRLTVDGPWLFRSHQPQDLDALFALDLVCFEPSFRFTRRSMRRFAEAGNARVVIAECHDGMIAGFCILHVERAGDGLVGYIVTLDVAPEHRRKGLAHRLMQAVERQAVAAGCSSLVLHVHTCNAAAIRFYERIGFNAIGLEESFYGPKLDAAVWTKSLGVPISLRSSAS